MSTAIIELNDSGILWRSPNSTETAPPSPGYALLQNQGVVTGQQALQQAWLQPQQSFNQYWYQLSLSPLSLNNHHARHHADLAYAQLQQLYSDTGQAQQMIFAMPSNTTAEQLSILLGLVKALPFAAAGLVDAAVAATSQAGLQGVLLHADIQLHTTVVCQLNSVALVQRESVHQYPDIALKAIHDTWAQFIADRFIREYRYDPLHTAAGEQQLHERLPGWIVQLNSAREIETELSAPQGNFRLRIQRSDFIAANQKRWQRLVEALANTPYDSLLLSHRLASLPGVLDSLETAGHRNIVTLAADATITACLAQGDSIAAGDDNQGGDRPLSFITALPALSPVATRQNSSTTRRQQGSASHLLHKHRAYPLAQGLALLSDGTLLIRGEATDSMSGQLAATLGLDDGRVVLTQCNHSIALSCDGDWHNLHSGDVIAIAAQNLTLIEVG
ncbi:hypothetical protein A9Q90_06980 [Gammaproteobacteria bacterium 54_18_T64]|nr:hypothetical protein A9Q90_06980 [Gammaproteobacteria bacterium 54_18_T64]